MIILLSFSPPLYHIFWGEIKFLGRTLNLGNRRRGHCYSELSGGRWRDLPLGREAALGEVMGRRHCQPGQGCPWKCLGDPQPKRTSQPALRHPQISRGPYPTAPNLLSERGRCAPVFGVRDPGGGGTPQGLGINERGFPTPPQGPRAVPLTGEYTQLGGSSYPPEQQGEAQCWVGHDPAASCNEVKGTQPPHLCFPILPGDRVSSLWREDPQRCPHPPEPQFPPL